MCGIAGFVAGRSQGVPSESLSTALRTLEHRGPDDFGFFASRGEQSYRGRDTAGFLSGAELLLVHRRLSILDTSEAGWQPMASADENYVIVFNGEVYNFMELRTELEQLGHRFHSRSDTEVLLAAYQAWGIESLRRLVGMFAFAIFDRRQGRLLLARDFFGIKPLYYAAASQQFGFASEIPPLLETLDVSRRVNPTRLFYYLRFGLSDHGDETLFADVHQLPAAHYLWIDASTLALDGPHRYWSVDQLNRSDLSFEEAVSYVRRQFLENVRIHLRSDVPLGAALSGGIDSSAIVAAMRQLSGHAADLHLFSYVSDDQKISEEKWINIMAESTGGTLHVVRTEAESLADELSAVTRWHGEPTAGSSVYAQHHIFRMAREQGVKVMLDGQGADEILGGYRHYYGARLASLMRAGDLGRAAKLLKRVSQLPDVGWWLAVLYSADHMLPGSWQRPLRRMVGKDLVPEWMNYRWFRDRGVDVLPVKYTEESDVLRDCLLRAVQERGLAHLLRYEDRNSMACSVESRLPFLTPDLASFLLSLPEEFLISDDGVTKSVFREAMRGLVPNAILDRQDKIGFATPEHAWMTSQPQWVQSELRSEVCQSILAFSPDVSRPEYTELCRRNVGNNLWRWLSLIEWTRQFNVDYN